MIQKKPKKEGQKKEEKTGNTNGARRTSVSQVFDDACFNAGVTDTGTSLCSDTPDVGHSYAWHQVDWLSYL